MGEMAPAEVLAEFLGEDEQGRAPKEKVLGEKGEQFLRALCELLEIQGRRGGEAIVVCPEGPETLH